MSAMPISPAPVWEDLYVKGARWCDIEDTDDSTACASDNESLSSRNTAMLSVELDSSQLFEDRTLNGEGATQVACSEQTMATTLSLDALLATGFALPLEMHTSHMQQCSQAWVGSATACWTPQLSCTSASRLGTAVDARACPVASPSVDDRLYKESSPCKQKRSRPSKAKREAYRIFVAQIEAAIQDDPHSVDIENIDVPDSLADQEEVKAMLQKKLIQRLLRTKAASLQGSI